MKIGQGLEDAAELAVKAGIASAPQIQQAKIVIGAIVAAFVALVLGALFYWFIIRPQNLAADAAKSHGEAVIAQHGEAATAKAFKIVDDTRAAHAASDVTTERNDHAIKSAADAATPVPGVARALQDALCLRAVYALEPDCQAVPAAAQGDAPARANTGSAPPAER